MRHRAARCSDEPSASALRAHASANSRFSASWLAWAPQPRAASHGLAPHRAAARAAACSAAWEGARGDCNVARYAPRRPGYESAADRLTCAYRLEASALRCADCYITSTTRTSRRRAMMRRLSLVAAACDRAWTLDSNMNASTSCTCRANYPAGAPSNPFYQYATVTSYGGRLSSWTCGCGAGRMVPNYAVQSTYASMNYWMLYSGLDPNPPSAQGIPQPPCSVCKSGYTLLCCRLQDSTRRRARTRTTDGKSIGIYMG